MISIFELIQINLGILAFLASGVLIVGRSSRDLVGWSLAVSICAIGLSVLPMTLLGYVGLFHVPVLRLLPWGVLALVALMRRAELVVIKEQFGAHILAAWGALKRGHRFEKLMWCVLGLLIVSFALTICFSTPAIYDSLDYRLPRIANWFQNGAISHFEVSDQRQNWMPVVPDLMMAWVHSHNLSDFSGVQFAQLLGGGVALLSLYKLGQLFRLSRIARVAALLVFVTLPNVFVQFYSSHTDLITAGYTLAGLAFLLESFQKKQFSWLAGVCWALAFGSKGILFYWVIGLPYILLYLIYRFRPSFKFLLQNAVSFVAASVFFLLPKHVENQIQYGNPFAEQAIIDAHHVDIIFIEGAKKTYLNALSYLTQLNEPYSNSFLIRGVTDGVGKKLAGSLPESEAYLFDSSNRRETWMSIFDRATSDSDSTSFGSLQFVVMVCGFVLIVIKPNRADPLLKHLSISLLLFFLYFCYKQNGHAYAYRYFVIVSGPLALLSVFWVDQIAKKWRISVVAALLLLPITNVFGLWMNNSQLGYNNIFHADRMRDLIVYKNFRDLVQSPMAGELDVIYVRGLGRLTKSGVYTAAADVFEVEKLPEELVDGEALLLESSLLQFMLGKFVGQSLIVALPSNQSLNFSLIYKPSAGVELRPFIYAYQFSPSEDFYQERFSIFSNRQPAVTVEVQNRAEAAHRFQWMHAGQAYEVVVPPGAQQLVEMPLPVDGDLVIRTSMLVGEDVAQPSSLFVYRIQGVVYPNEFE